MVEEVELSIERRCEVGKELLDHGFKADAGWLWCAKSSQSRLGVVRTLQTSSEPVGLGRQALTNGWVPDMSHPGNQGMLRAQLEEKLKTPVTEVLTELGWLVMQRRPDKKHWDPIWMFHGETRAEALVEAWVVVCGGPADVDTDREETKAAEGHGDPPSGS